MPSLLQVSASVLSVNKRYRTLFDADYVHHFLFLTFAEVLQEEVMEYVNSIAHIVHTAITAHGGAANKNIGDAFLLVWKFPRGFTEKDIRDLAASAGNGSLAGTGRFTPPMKAITDAAGGAMPATAKAGVPVAEAGEDDEDALVSRRACSAATRNTQRPLM